jgi:pyruvate/2-oxoglutarate dehydrogenase complex dihydrolipoamide dehydrogenase (E3) component
MHLQSSVRAAVAKGNGVCLRVSCQDGKETMLTVDHVIAATGFHVDIQRLPFLHADLLSQVRRIEDAPMLSRFFESSVPGLYFIGITAANSFGPLLRFVLGTGFTGPRLGQHLASRATG